MDTKTLEKLQRIYDQADTFGKSLMEKEFPELKESDDSKMKELFENLVLSLCDTPSAREILQIYGKSKEDCLTWLEKKGKEENLKEHNICDTCEESNGCVTPCCAKLLEKQDEQASLWLKSIKERMKGECISVTDEELAQAKKDAYNDALDKIEYHSGEPTFDDGWSAAIWYLKKKQPQNTWKPSDRQIDGIECAIKTLQHQLNVGDKRLDSLYNDLKKLREE